MSEIVQRAKKPARIFMMDLLATVPYYTAYLSKALIRAGAEVQVGSITYYLDRDCFSSRGIRPDPGLLDVVGRYNLPALPRRVLKLVEGLLNLAALMVRFSAEAPEIIHVQYLPMLRWPIPFDLWFVEFWRKRGAKIMLTVHDLMPHDTADTYRQTFRKLYGDVDRIICHSDHIRARLCNEFEVQESKVSVIPHGPFFYDLPTSPAKAVTAIGEVQVLWQGIIFPYKGVDLLLKAWQRIELAGVNARLVIAGTGSPTILAEIQDLVLRLELKRVVLQLRFISTEELVGLYRAADIVVYPYRAITTSGALATGLALGKTILASNLPVFREILTDGLNASLVNPENTFELGAALLELLQDVELRERYATKIRAMNFGDASWDGIAGLTLDSYELLLRR